MPPRRRDRSDDETHTLSYNEVLVLQALATGCRYGFEVMSVTGISAGTVYPILRRCEARGHVSSEREDEENAHQQGRPARRLHRITREGRSVLARAREELLERHRALGLTH